MATWASGVRAEKPAGFAPNQIIIKLKKSAPQSAAPAVRAELNATVKQRFERIGAELWDIKGITVADAVARYRNDPRVLYVEPNYALHADDVFPNDPRFGEQWALHNSGQTGGTPDADIDAPEAWSIGTGGTVLVGIIDTGVDWHHPDLAANIFTNPGEIAGNGIDDDKNGFVDDVHGWDFVNYDNDPFDDNRHGTHVAGTIAAVGDDSLGVAGVSWSARILPLKFLDAEGYGWTSDAVLAVQYATRMGVRLTSNSWGGGGYSESLRDAIVDAGNQGILFIAAAGNSSGDNDDYPHYPSNYDLDNIIAVASTDHTDALSYFSNYGLTSVDLGAPGSGILSTFPNNSYGTLSGTSMATPHVSGAVSLVWALDPSKTALEVKNLILATVDPLPSLAGRVVSGGRLNIHSLLESLDKVPPARVQNLAVQSTGSSSALLAWTASGDDDAAGTANTYDLRYSTAGIDAANFDAATRVAGTPHPASAGSAESFEVSGLDFNTKYYFALVVADERGNRSALSNLASGTTLGVPHLKSSPGSFSAGLHTGGSKSRVLTLTNNAKGTLDFALATSPAWVRLNPLSGRVNAGQSLPVEVIFDATRLSGGAHDSTLTLATNDPTQRRVAFRISVQITNAADLAVNRASLDFGAHYIGLCARDTVVVTNIGTVALNVTGVSTSSPDFSTDKSPFVLNPGQGRTLAVSFCPTTAARLEGSLSLRSNDPDHPTVTVSLRGEGVAPPVIAVSPSSLSENLLTGGVSNQTLSILNEGGSDLSFELAIKDVAGPTAPGAALVAKRETLQTTSGDLAKATSKNVTPAMGRHTRSAQAHSYTAGRAGSRTDRIETSRQPVNLSASALKILLLRTADVYEIRDLLMSFPDIAAVDEFDGELATPALATLRKYDAVILIENYPLADPVGVGNVLADYVDGGGGVVMTIASFDSGWEVRGRFATGGYFPFTLAVPPWFYASMGNHDATHPIMAGVTSASGDLLSPTTLAPGAEWVASWDDGSPFIATQGNHVVGVNVFVAEYGYWYGDVPLILHNAVAWASRPDWIKIATKKGVIAAHSRMDIPATFNAAGLYGGNYSANLNITDNDPFHLNVVVPVSMHVTGAPDIAVSKPLLDYGPQFIGAAITDTLVVSNDGTDFLAVSSISSSRPEYTVDISSFTLAPAKSQDVLVTFAPTTTGPAPATLTITSNDFDEGSMAIELQGAGVDPPIISVTPESLSEDLLTGATATHTLTISNAGESPLSFSIAGEDLGGPLLRAASPARNSGPRASSSAHIDKSHRDTRSYPPMEHVKGGPDAFGYSWRDNNEATGPQFDWIDVSGGSNIWLWDDGFDADVPLGFTFTYYGEEFTTIGVASNGWLSFTGVNDWFPGDVPSNDYYPGAIAPYARDLYPPAGHYVRYQTFGMAPHRQFVVEYNNIPNYPSGNNKTFEVILTEGANSIRFQYLVASGPPEGFGIESPDQSMGMGNAGTGDLFISPMLVRNNYAIEFAAMPQWLEPDTREAVVPPHGSLDVSVTFKAAGLYGGNYAANILISNNDPLNSRVVIPAALHVTGAPDIAVSQSLLDYGALFIGLAVKDTLVVSNQGTDLLTVSNIVSSYPDYTVDTTSFALEPKANQNVVVTFAPASAGLHPATLRIISDDPDENAMDVSLSGTGVEPPVIAVTPTALSGELFTGGTLTRQVTIDNSAGGSDLIWNVSIQPPRPSWFQVDPSSGTLPAHASAVVNASFNATAMYGGDYDTKLMFTSNDPTKPEVEVGAHLHVTGAPDISVTPEAVSFGTVFTGQKADRKVTIANTGTDVLWVSSISSNRSEVTVDVADFMLEPSGARDVVVSFAPTAVAEIDADLTVASNDPDEGTLTIHATANGADPPIISVTPGELSDTLSVGKTTSRTVTVSNRGASNLEIRVAVVEDPAPLARLIANDTAQAVPAPAIVKGAPDTRSYPPMTRASGGPDPFGYRWRDSHDPHGPVFNWIDVSGGTSLVMGDDEFVTGVPLGFTFSYYGQLFTSVGVGSNGWLSFNGFNTWFPNNVPGRDNCTGAIAPYAMDLLPPNGGYVRYQTFGVAPHRQFVVEYHDIPRYTGAVFNTFEVIFSEGTNSIRFQYLQALTGPWGFGIESPDETMGMGNAGAGDQYISPGVVESYYAIEFAALPQWLSVTPATATIAAGQSLDLAAILDADHLESGKYTGLLSIDSNDPITPFVPVYVTLLVDSTATVAIGLQQAERIAQLDIPTRYELHANHPNPFNPTTTIAYDLPRASNVRLTIYDVGGRKVAELVNAMQPAGRHEMVWDGRDSSRGTVSSGVYFYRLVAANFVQTRKMVLLK